LKRIIDIILSAIVLILLWPLLLAIGIAIKLDSNGPIFYLQERIGRGEHPFRIWKFRTMIIGADRIGPLITRGGDRRVTRVGRWLRRSKVDELPQLVNVLKGDMSLVGPRPEVRRYVELFHEDYTKILSVRPGLTDLASLAFADEETRLAETATCEDEYLSHILPEKIRLAKLYIDNSSLSLDVQLMLRTLLRLARGR